ncbi:hypothetical protein BP6252_14097 [Coleophoma cylindrospora]|uniref:Uncharacterized protein n=1 Tax=Coleophoma cylindrospora TaxID=1849047 RepID=A0A3D8Q401_9HELO|nr:hypothetical protein BP6252_14097 [Coleophoma cylindrospora]
MANTNSISGALGSIIGYVGAEVAERVVFERLFWPDRFYKSFSPGYLLKTMFLSSMSGPLHKAALETLDKLRQNGLYRGKQQGHMLGTAFFDDLHLQYRVCGHEDKAFEVRNGMLIRILQNCRPPPSIDAKGTFRTDAESRPSIPYPPTRTSHPVHHLTLQTVGSEDKNLDQISHFAEEISHFRTFCAIVASEMTAIICAATICIVYRCFWFSVYLLFPMLLKLISVQTRMRREQLAEVEPGKDSARIAMFELVDRKHGLFLIEGPDSTVRQFFRHYGHPIRVSKLDRVKELIGIALVAAFVFHFPVGLLSMLWVQQEIQNIWIVYQVYLVIAYHVARLTGANDSGRIEIEIARQLMAGGKAILGSGSGTMVVLSLVSQVFEHQREALERVKEIKTSDFS